MNSAKNDDGEGPTGYVKIIREGNQIITGSRIERITKSGEPVFQGVNGENTCRWVRELRGDPRYSSPPVTSASARKTLSRHYVLMPGANTYALGVKALQNACSKETNAIHPQYIKENGTAIYRPLTFRENLQARVDNFNRLHEENGAERSPDKRLRLFYAGLDSCTGIVYKKGTHKIKIIPVCKNLIAMDYKFDDRHLSVDYGILDGEELDLDKGEYNVFLTKAEAIEHPAWLAAVENDKALLKEYAGIVFAQLKNNHGMGPWILNTTNADALRELSVDHLYNRSDVNGYYDLSCRVYFLREVLSDTPKRH